MRKSVCTEFFKKYLKEVSAGRGYREHINPAVDFTKRAKAGEYDKLSDEGYSVLLSETEDISRFWLNKQNQKAEDIFRVALEDIEIDEKTLSKMAELLAECYQASMGAFVSPEVPEKSGDQDEEYISYDDIDADLFWLSEEEKSELQSEDAAGQKKQEKASPSFAKEEKKKRQMPEAGTFHPFYKMGGGVLSSPREISHYLEKRIYGQRDAVRAAAMLLYNHAHGRKRNLLFLGPTGCGKTEIWRVCKEIYPEIHIIDSTRITGEGWTGSFKIKNIFDNMGRVEAEKSIIVFDEFDKLCEPQIGSGGSNHSLIAQNELLKLIEGAEISGTKDHGFDSSKISFVFCGSFDQLTVMKNEKESKKSVGFGAELEKKEAKHIYEGLIEPSDLVSYAGVRQEIAGRINQIVQLSPMTADDYRMILRDSQISPLFQLERQYNIKLQLDEKAEEQLARQAEETGMGVRYLRSRLQQMLDDQMFCDCGRSQYRLGETLLERSDEG